MLKFSKLLFLSLLLMKSFACIATTSKEKIIENTRFNAISTCIQKNNQYFLCEFIPDKNKKINFDECIKIKKSIFDFLYKSSSKELMNQPDNVRAKASSSTTDTTEHPPIDLKHDPG